ncbi:MAG TPA: alpha/beta fold hydrolase [Candidatus Angelobacter sp.]|nr:alpha/beta fold hydrolase [Candidatus Angelobacter sp.]
MARFSRRYKFFVFLFVALAAIGLGGFALRRPATAYLRSMAVLQRFSNPQATGFVAGFAQHAIEEKTETAQTPQGPLQYRLYLPQGVKHPGGILLLHGIHHLGIEDPRLVGLARAISSAGVAVMTPQIQDLAEYRVTPASIDVIGASAAIFCQRLGDPKVGVTGMSFAGGLALLAAARPEYAGNISFVLAVGAHDDMSRVARFFVENSIEAPDGSNIGFQAHEYGVLVFAYTHLENFFSAKDAPVAREYLRQKLWENPVPEDMEKKLSPSGRATLDQLLNHRELLHKALLHQIWLHKAEMDAVSPHGRLNQLTMPVFLLHGSGDTLIPPSETLWLAREVPQQELKTLLISPALIHVTMENKVTWSQQWALISLMAQVLDSASRSPETAPA